ncbi:MAG: caspase family protein [Deltaproteobacteria bacterium]|nr:caspase family protein [Deltaproteobacteria bacterium]
MTLRQVEGLQRGGKRALLIGINDYPHFRFEAQLKGAVHDVETMDSLLRDFGFDTEDVEILTNDRATRAGIVSAMQRLLSRTCRGDTVVVHFSGHGSRRRAPGCIYRGEDLESVLVTNDSSHEGDEPNRDISGSELYTWLRHLSVLTPRVTLVLDCCHAGTMARKPGAELRVSRQRGDGVRVREVEPDERFMEELPFPWSMDDTALPGPGETDWLPMNEALTLIAACTGNERASEMNIEDGSSLVSQGALTEALGVALKEAPEGATYNDLLPVITHRVRRLYPDQHPQIEGARNRVILGIEERRPRREVSVISSRQSDLVLDVGSLHGVGAGSIWGIYPPTFDKLTGEAPWKAQVTLTAPGRSDAILLPGGARGEVPIGGPAVELVASPHPAPLVVALEIPEAHRDWGAELALVIDGLPSVRRTEDSSRADIVAAILEPRKFPRPKARAAKLGAVKEPVCVLVDAKTNDLTARWQPLAHLLALTNTKENLEGIASFRHFLGLDNSHDDSLKGKVRMELLRRDLARDGGWIPAVPAQEEEGGVIDFDCGEYFAIDFFNDHDKPLFIHLFDLGLSGRIDPLFPLPGAQEPLSPRKRFRLGDRKGQELWFEVPDTLPFEEPGAKDWAGLETFKLLVTEEPTDLASLAQESYRSRAGASGALGHSLGQVLAPIFHNARREARSGVSPRSEAWWSESVTLRLRRYSQETGS